MKFVIGVNSRGQIIDKRMYADGDPAIDSDFIAFSANRPGYGLRDVNQDTYNSSVVVLDDPSALIATDQDANAIKSRAIVLVAKDEVNILREWLMAFQSAVAASTSLANMQARVAALPNLPDRTAQQAKNAVLNKMGSGEAG